MSHIGKWQTLLDRLAEYHIFNAEELQQNPHWERATKVHDWRNYVPEDVRDCWDDMDTFGQLSVMLIAARQAHLEDHE